MNVIGPFPPGGRGGLRKMLEEIGEDGKELNENPLYKEGFDDGAVYGYELARLEFKDLFLKMNRLFDDQT